MNIYSFPTYNLTKILMVAEEAGAPYTLHWLDNAKAEHKSPAHLARHPLGKVPAIELDGAYYFESNSICRLIAEKHAPALYAETPERRAAINQWLDLMSMHVARWLSTVFLEESLAPRFFGRETNQDAIAEAHNFLDQQLPAVDAQLANSGFLANDKLTIADLAGCSYFETTAYSSVDLSAYPNIQNWLQAIRSRSSYTNALAQFPGGKTFAMLD